MAAWPALSRPTPRSTNTTVDQDALLDFVQRRHQMLLVTLRPDGRPQVSPVTGGVDAEGRIVIATYPERAKTVNARRNPKVSVVVLSDDFSGPWVHVDGDGDVLDPPESIAAGRLLPVDLGRASRWDEYRQAMREQGKSLLRVTATRWGPIATGGFPRVWRSGALSGASRMPACRPERAAYLRSVQVNNNSPAAKERSPALVWPPPPVLASAVLHCRRGADDGANGSAARCRRRRRTSAPARP